jgi:threonine synthase
VRGPYDAANRLSVRASMELDGVGWVNVELRPWYVEGGTTVAYEIAEQLGWTAPDHVVAPMASGALVTKLHDGLEAVRRLGLVPSRPTRISGAQPAGCAPIARAFAAGATTVAPVRDTATVAPSLAMADPPDGDRVLAIARSTGGAVVEVPEDEIADGVELLSATEAIAVEPAGGVVVAALRRMVASGAAAAGERIVAVLTGGPAPSGMAGDVEGFGTIDPTVEALRSALTDRSRNR